LRKKDLERLASFVLEKPTVAVEPLATGGNAADPLMQLAG
jgi:hypothetical protein